MALSDACSDFRHHKFGDDIIASRVTAAKRLLEEVEHYGQPDYPINYPPEHIEALRIATKAALAKPDDIRLWRRLYVLTELVREHYDAFPLIRDALLDSVLEDLIRKLMAASPAVVVS